MDTLIKLVGIFLLSFFIGFLSIKTYSFVYNRGMEDGLKKAQTQIHQEEELISKPWAGCVNNMGVSIPNDKPHEMKFKECLASYLSGDWPDREKLILVPDRKLK